jgi:hypothetical protein
LHLPYHESDHVLNLTYNLLAGGQRLEDIELRRQDEVFLNGLGAERIPDPTTAGDFTRRDRCSRSEHCVDTAIGPGDRLSRIRKSAFTVQDLKLLEGLAVVDPSVEIRILCDGEKSWLEGRLVRLTVGIESSVDNADLEITVLHRL